MDGITYTLFFKNAQDLDLIVYISTTTGVIFGCVTDIHADGVTILRDDDVLFSVGFSTIQYVGSREKCRSKGTLNLNNKCSSSYRGRYSD